MGSTPWPDLPITDVLPDVVTAMRNSGVAVLQAPPGAGKTTLVPLALMQDGAIEGRIVMLEPRRLAALAAAERMAELLGEPAGQTVGYRMRGATKVGKSTRIEVVTEGILTRMIQSDPELAGIGCLIFDEFHERSLNADLGLALAVEVRQVLRPDLRLFVMSATLDAQPVADLLKAPIITSQGHMHPVETRWLDKPLPPAHRFAESSADLIASAVGATQGGILVFAPGEGEIRRIQALLQPRVGDLCQILPLFGAMDFKAQRRAIEPLRDGRKLVLATSIAETSLTIRDIRVVVDLGRARRMRFDPGSGMARLITESVTRAEADQRRGRAGRIAPGVCYRMWTKAQEGGLHAYPPPEIQAGDLTGLVLDLTLWGTLDPGDLAFLSQPNAGGFANAQALLRDLGALDGENRITPHGRQMAAVPTHPRLAHMVLRGGPQAADLAALLGERDPLGRGSADLARRREALIDPGRFQRERGIDVNRGVIERIKADAKRLKPHAKGSVKGWAALAALAYPDRIGQRRPGDAPRYVLSGGKGAVLTSGDPMANAPMLVATDLDGDAREARIWRAIEIDEATVRELFADRIIWREACSWSSRERRVVARQQETFGALILSDRVWKKAPADMLARAALDGMRDIGLPLSGAAQRFIARVEFARQGGETLPDCSATALIDTAEDWLLPHLGGLRSEAQLRDFDPLPAIRERLSWDQQQQLDRLAPPHFTTPLGNRTPIDYGAETPEISVRLQEMFGLTKHPVIGPAQAPLRITLLSPARRPLQTTTNLPGFWASSYLDVRKDMRGRYPKHPWPEDPTKADPTLRAKPRGR